MSQALQALPFLPQVVNAGTLQMVPWQQPFGHDMASHTHAPFMHRWPASHGGPPPQRQAPSIEQVSTLPVSQPMHAAPAVPHVDTDRG